MFAMISELLSLCVGDEKVAQAMTVKGRGRGRGSGGERKKERMRGRHKRGEKLGGEQAE